MNIKGLGETVSFSRFVYYASFVLGFLILGVYFHNWVVARGEKIERDATLKAIKTAAAGIDPGLLTSLRAVPEELGTENYESIRKVLLRIKQANNEIRFIYTLLRIGESILFLVDAEPPDSPDFSPPGQVYSEVPDQFVNVFNTARADVVGPFSDRWGTWVSSIAPIVDTAGNEVVAAVAMDVDASNWSRNISTYGWFAIAIVGLVAFIVMLFGAEILQLRASRIKISRREARFRRLLESTPDSTLVVDDKGNIVLANAISERTFGYPVAELLKQNISDLIPQRFRAAHLRHLDDYRVDPTARDMGSGMELYALRKDGREFPVEISLSPIEMDEGLLVFACVRDVTQRKDMEDELRKKARAIEQSPASVVITDVDGNVEYVNPKFLRLTGYTVDEAIEQSPTILKPGILPPERYTELWTRILKGENWEGEYSNKKKDGALYWERAYVSPVRNVRGKVTHYVAVKEDITERKRITEELKAAKVAADDANQAKSDFLAKMSHEIRTPMNAIIGMSHLALQTALSPKQEDYILKTNRAAHSLLGIINDILDFSKIEAGKMDVEDVDFHLEDVLDNLANMLAVKTQEKGLELLFSIANDVPKGLIGDPLRLGQILVNLSNNAIKFTEQGEILVAVTREGEQGGKVKLRFSVKDSGIGIPQQKLPTLFQEFTQADASTTRKYGGTGLGLAICKRLAELMGGTVWAESEPGQGSTFVFTVLCGKQDEQAQQRYKPSLDLREMKVLVVDDNSDAREIYQSYLEDFSFEVRAAGSGQQAIKELERNSQLENEKPYGLIMMDWNMPGMNGIEASSRIKQKIRSAKQPKIIMLSAFGREELMQQADRVGIDGFLIKPVNQSILFDTIMSVFGEESPSFTAKVSKSSDYSEPLRKIKGASILLAEDNEINQQVAAELLEKEQLVVSIADNGKAAVESVENWDYDAVLMDIEMPEMDGYQATREIRKKDKFKHLPIIAMTAHAMSGDKEKCLDAGMLDVVTKPIDPDQLFSTLVKWIKPGDRKVVTAGQQKHTDTAPTDELPTDLPGIDVPTGLTRVAGNKKLFRKILLSFRSSNSNTTDEIKQALNNDDLELAQRLAHTVKGVAGNIAADDLYNSAADLEQAIKNRVSNQYARLLDDFSEKHAFLIASIAGLETEAKNLPPPEDQQPVDKDQVLPLLKDLMALLEEDVSEAAQRLEDLKGLLGPSRFKSDIDKLTEQFEEFDFDGVGEMADRIAQRLDPAATGPSFQ